jgi:hypothetical protein
MTGKIKGKEYDTEFNGLLHHFNLCRGSIPDFEGIDEFMKRYQLEACITASQRIKEGKSGYKGEESEKGLAVRVMDITSKMINCLDLLSIDIYDIDRVSPAVIDIKSALNNYPNLPAGNECTEKIDKWVNILKTK